MLTALLKLQLFNNELNKYYNLFDNTLFYVDLIIIRNCFKNFWLVSLPKILNVAPPMSLDTVIILPTVYKIANACTSAFTFIRIAPNLLALVFNFYF